MIYEYVSILAYISLITGMVKDVVDFCSIVGMIPLLVSA